MLLVVAADQGESHGEVGDGVSGQKQGEAAQVKLIDAQGSGEPLDDHLAVRLEVELGDFPADAVVDEAPGQFQGEVAPHRREGALGVEAVIEDAVEDGLTDRAVVVGPGGDAHRPGAEGLAAATARLALGIVDVEAGHLAVGQRADTTAKAASAASGDAAVRAGMALGAAADDADRRQDHGLCSWGARK